MQFDCVLHGTHASTGCIVAEWVKGAHATDAHICVAGELEPQCHSCLGPVRAIRNADSSHSVQGAFCMLLRPWCKASHTKVQSRGGYLLVETGSAILADAPNASSPCAVVCRPLLVAGLTLLRHVVCGHRPVVPPSLLGAAYAHAPSTRVVTSECAHDSLWLGWAYPGHGPPLLNVCRASPPPIDKGAQKDSRLARASPDSSAGLRVPSRHSIKVCSRIASVHEPPQTPLPVCKSQAAN